MVPAAVCAVILVAVILLAAPLKTALEQSSYPLKYSDEVVRWAGKYDIDPYLVYALARTESGFDPEAESNVGARGLMQMTEETFSWIETKLPYSSALTFDDLFVPDTSIRFGTCYFSMCMERYGGDISTAAAAYHSGWGTVDALLLQEAYSKDGITLSEFPFLQMANYVYKINRSYDMYKSLYAAYE